ncbi:MAG: hypothetical protein KKE62_13345 [Proteobacteria bacterium]|nr:hypothetical protein [Pseudomonadota bacterium]MBU1389806.1 hypothetical protein [Pseudomonadota bacterium]MBU1543815.1 hypothetical protein [Pseudomonadota bacterium]MBU2431631.1 hypothetical protein [Pseudomonadota bacterium]MBU2482744.1 hypothetical protein [Pseudomonadota bacterium]
MTDMSIHDDSCLDCGVFLTSSSLICPVCGFDNTMGQLYDIPVDGKFFIESMESTGRSTAPN